MTDRQYGHSLPFVQACGTHPCKSRHVYEFKSFVAYHHKEFARPSTSCILAHLYFFFLPKTTKNRRIRSLAIVITN